MIDDLRLVKTQFSLIFENQVNLIYIRLVIRLLPVFNLISFYSFSALVIFPLVEASISFEYVFKFSIIERFFNLILFL